MDIQKLKIEDIPDQVTRAIVTKIVERMYLGMAEFGDLMHECDKDPEQMFNELIEEGIDLLCYAEMGKRGLNGSNDRS